MSVKSWLSLVHECRFNAQRFIALFVQSNTSKAILTMAIPHEGRIYKHVRTFEAPDTCRIVC